MPGLDKTGPMGKGSQTGRKQGNCSDNSSVTLEDRPLERRMGRGFKNRRNQDVETGAGFRAGRGRGLGRGLRRGQNT